MSNKSRDVLYSLFTTGNKPTQDDFADLIDSMINITDDGIGISGKGEPMEILQQGSKLRLVDFSSAPETPVWRIGAQSDGVSGLNIATADDQSRLFIKKENGYVGVNNDNPAAQLHITSDLNTAILVEDTDQNPSLIVEADGRVGVGMDAQEAYEFSVGGRANFKDDATLEGSLSVNKGAVIYEGAVIETGELEAKQGLTVNEGAVIETGKLEAKKGLTVSEGIIVETGTLEAQNGLTANGGIIVETGSLEARQGLTVNGDAVVETGKLEAKKGLTVSEGIIVETGALEAQQGLTANGGIIVETGALEANQGLTVNGGAVIETGNLGVMHGLTVNGGVEVETGLLKAGEGFTVEGGATIETGSLTVKQGLAVTEDSALNANGPVSLGNSTDGMVTINGKLQASDEVTVTGKLNAKKGVSINGDLNVPDNAALGSATINNLMVDQITVNGNLGLQSVNLESLTAAQGEIQNLTSGILAVSGECQTSGDVTLDSGIIYVTYDGTASDVPRLNIKKGTISEESGHFDIDIDDSKLMTIIYDDASDFSVLATDWETYQSAQPDKVKGFSLIQLGISSWKMQDREIDFVATGIYKEHIIAETGLHILYVANSSNTPQFTIKAKEDTETDGFQFSVDGALLTIEYPSNETVRTVTQLISDWQTWLGSNFDSAGGFEIGKTADSSGESLVSDVNLTDLAVNAGGNIFNKAIIKTNTVTMNSLLKFDDSNVLINSVSNSATLAENSDGNLVTQKAVKTYVDNGLSLKADQTAMNAALALKADQSVMTTELAKKADQTAVNAALGLKADQSTMTTELAKKADQAAMTASLALKADRTEMTASLALKADQNAMTSALALKADQSTMTTELAKKADQTAMTASLALKADQEAMTAALALKAGLFKPSDRTVTSGKTATVSDLSLTTDSRGVLMVRITAGDIAKAGLFAIHGNDSLLKIAGNGMTDEAEQSNSLNLYVTAGAVELQNTMEEDVSVKLTYFGA